MAIVNKWTTLSIRKKVCLTVILMYILVAIFAPALMNYEITDFSHPSLEAPNSTYWLGTDEMGHDLFSLLIHGFRLTVGLALISGFLSHHLLHQLVTSSSKSALMNSSRKG